jgi:hypothetical protein
VNAPTYRATLTPARRWFPSNNHWHFILIRFIHWHVILAHVSFTLIEFGRRFVTQLLIALEVFQVLARLRNRRARIV